ncbi:hypothetical protein [Maribacter arenosus]|nr:hypothetical protein [Maribacter arenosus]
MAYVLPLVNWGNGIIMIGVFGAVVIGLVVTLIIFMNSGKRDKN